MLVEDLIKYTTSLVSTLSLFSLTYAHNSQTEVLALLKYNYNLVFCHLIFIVFIANSIYDIVPTIRF